MGALELERCAFGHQLPQANGLVRGDPVGRVVGRADGDRRELVNQDRAPAHGLAAEDQAQGRRAELLLVATLQHQQFDVGQFRMAHQPHRGAQCLGQFKAFGAWLLRADQHDGMAIGQAVAPHREDRAALSRERAQPRGHDGRGAQAVAVRLGPENHGHLDTAGATAIEPGRGKQGQLVFQGERSDREFEARRVHIHFGPQAVVQRVFARQGVVPDQAQAEPVVVHEQTRVELDGPHDPLTRVVRANGNDGQQLVVEADLKVGQGGQQGRGGRDCEVQAGAHHHFIESHAQVDALLAVRAPKR